MCVCVSLTEPSPGGIPYLPATGVELCPQDNRQDLRGHRGHHCHRHGDGATARQGACSAQQHDHGEKEDVLSSHVLHLIATDIYQKRTTMRIVDS